MAQDERYFRELFSGELAGINKSNELPKKHSFVVSSAHYQLDLNGDELKESIAFVKKDNEDWLEIYDYRKNLIFTYLFENKGTGSELFRVELKTLSQNTNILLLHYYEGSTNYLHFQGTARVYAVTIDNKNLKTLTAFRGASFFDETKKLKGHYHIRSYSVFLEDLDENGIKDLVVKFRNISTVFHYLGNGKWSTL